MTIRQLDSYKPVKSMLSFAPDTLVLDVPQRNSAIGVDVGFHNFANFSNGTKTNCRPLPLAMALAREYQLVCTEARSPMLVRFDTFFNALDSYCKKFSSVHVSVGRYFPSTRKCSSCGFVHPPLDVKIRAWECGNCTTQHDRDINAAKNILNEGLRLTRVVNLC